MNRVSTSGAMVLAEPRGLPRFPEGGRLGRRSSFFYGLGGRVTDILGPGVRSMPQVRMSSCPDLQVLHDAAGTGPP